MSATGVRMRTSLGSRGTELQHVLVSRGSAHFRILGHPGDARCPRIRKSAGFGGENVFWLTVSSPRGDPEVTNKCLLVKGAPDETHPAAVPPHHRTRGR